MSTNEPTAIVRATPSAITGHAESRHGMEWNYSREQMDLLKRTVAMGTSDDEFALFMATAQRLGLDPFAKQISAITRWNSRAGREVMTIQTTIDGFRAVAARTGELDGQEGPEWCGPDRAWVEAWIDEEPPAAARVVVLRKGCARGFTGVATWRSYRQTGRDGAPTGLWGKMPDVMLAKCAEALALRKAFPSQLSGVYIHEEMHQASNSNAPAPIDVVVMEERLKVQARIDACETLADLKALAPELERLPEHEKKIARDWYKRRQRALKNPPAPAPSVYDEPLPEWAQTADERSTTKEE